MSQSNRQRRAAKAKARQQKRTHAGGPASRGAGSTAGHTGWPSPEDWESSFAGWAFEDDQQATEPVGPRLTAAQVEEWIDLWALHLRGWTVPGQEVLGLAVPTLIDESDEVKPLVESRLRALLTRTVRQAWTNGWQPRDLHRTAAKNPLASAVLGDLMVAELSGYAPATVHPSFREQLAELGLTQWWRRDSSPLLARAAEFSLGWGEVVGAAMHVLSVLRFAQPLPLVCPPPGQLQPAARSASDVDEKILERVRQLLAKAESSTYEAEADTFTAGAQALMARHRIDAAMLAASQTRQSGPQTIRIYVDAPYEDPKCSLLSSISRSNECRTVWFKELGFVSVVGFETDLLAVETLFTSLLVQATTAMRRHGSQQDRSGRSRTRAFRSSFLLSYAYRIGERLEQVVAEEVGKASALPEGADLLPVLASRAEAVGATFDELFPHIKQVATRSVSDAHGWHAGRAAADQAALQRGAALT